MRVTIEITNSRGIELLMQFLQELKSENIKIVEVSDEGVGINIMKGDKSIDPAELFGIWSEAPRTLEEIRSKSWDRNWN